MVHEWIAWLAAISVSAIIGWCYGQRDGFREGYKTGKDVAGRMLENQDRMVSQLSKGDRK